MEARAVRKHIRSSPRKIRPLANLIRGKRVGEALGILKHMPQRATRPVTLTLESAVHNLTDRFRDERFDENDLIVLEIRVDEGPTLKRFQPVSRGRGHRILKRSSHLTVVVSTR
jgi:large subunit ribosomal protein L22